MCSIWFIYVSKYKIETESQGDEVLDHHSSSKSYSFNGGSKIGISDKMDRKSFVEISEVKLMFHNTSRRICFQKVWFAFKTRAINERIIF